MDLGEGVQRQAWRGHRSAHRLAHLLAQPILDGTTKPGEKLPNEKGLMLHYGAGRPTVREALLLLESRGLVSMKSGPGGGAVVAKPDNESLADSLTFLLEAEGARVQDVAEVRCVLEPVIANFAARRITEEQLDQLTETVAQMRRRPHSPSRALEQNSLFHKLVAATAHNPVLDIILKSLALVPERTGTSVRCTPEEAEMAASAHEGVIAALRTRDPAHAEQVMRRHVIAAVRYCEREYPMLMSRAVEWIF